MVEERERGESIDAIYLDFSKAFNSVPHQHLLLKLRARGVDGKLLNWVQAFLTGRQLRVRANSLKLEWAAVTSGVPQGPVLGPLLFVVHVNDLPRSFMIKMFTDTKIYRSVSRASGVLTLQVDLDTLVEWSERWQLPFNRSKCKSLQLGPRNGNHIYRMDDTQLDQTSVEKDLGIHVDQQLKFCEQAAAAILKASHILPVFRKSFALLDESTLPLLF